MNTKIILINLLLMASICTISIAAYHKLVKQQTAYVDIKKVFDSFEMKKDLELKYKATQLRRDKILDSLAANLRIISKYINEHKLKTETIEDAVINQFESKRQEYLATKSRFEQDNAALSQKYDSQIFEQINHYVVEYGKQYNYDFIYGADGSGSLMYSNDSYNVTDEISVFINNKYKGLQ